MIFFKKQCKNDTEISCLNAVTSEGAKIKPAHRGFERKDFSGVADDELTKSYTALFFFKCIVIIFKEMNSYF